MAGFMVLIGSAFLFLLLLVHESLRHNRNLKRIPLRITVSGTRGKTSIVRTLASVLRAHGMMVLAKTTGSEATYILQDGSTEKIRRRGLTTVLEQKKLISKAVRLKSNCVISEVMSIHPDNHQVETHKLLRPGITILSNFRADHTDVVGQSIPEISSLFSRDVYPGSKVIIPELELNDFILEGIREKNASLITAPAGISSELKLDGSVHDRHVAANLDTVVTAARHLGIPDRHIIRGILDTRLDIGQPGVFRFQEGSRRIWFVNAFAANDPVSTRQIMAKIREMPEPEITTGPMVIGLLSLRSDRGERSRQWLDYLKSDGRDLFSHLYVSGIHSPVFTRELKNCDRLRSRDPGEITRQIISSSDGDLLVFGIANIHGLGKQLIEYWKNHS